MENSVLNEVLCKLCTAMTHIRALISACNKRMTMSCRTSVVSDRPNKSPLKVEVFNRSTTVLSGVTVDLTLSNDSIGWKHNNTSRSKSTVIERTDIPAGVFFLSITGLTFTHIQ